MFLTLMYHLVDREIYSPMSISQEAFSSQMEALTSMSASFLTLNDVNRIFERSMIPYRGILISFDDGYKNTVDTALPILEKYQVSAVVSLCASYIYSDTCPSSTIHASQKFATVDDIKLWISSRR